MAHTWLILAGLLLIAGCSRYLLSIDVGRRRFWAAWVAMMLGVDF